MDTIVCSLGKSFYFCTVKTQGRHDMSAVSCTNRVLNVIRKTNSSECGSGNTHKAFDFECLTARTGVYILSKPKL